MNFEINKTIERPIEQKGLEKWQKVGPEKMGGPHTPTPRKKHRILLCSPRLTFPEAASLRSPCGWLFSWTAPGNQRKFFQNTFHRQNCQTAQTKTNCSNLANLY